MSRKNFYSVAKGTNTGIFTLWNKCEASVHKFHHAVFKGFHNIDQAIVFLMADGTYKSCNSIPVYDETTTAKSPKDYGHNCDSKLCNTENLDLSILEEDSNMCSTSDPSINDENETAVKQIEQLSSNTDTCTTDMQSQVNSDETQQQSNNNDPKVESKQKATSNKTTCTQSCKYETSEHMMQCNRCQGWTHYVCTKLPVYQLYLLVHTSRRYTCETCSNVTTSFYEKWTNKGAVEPSDNPNLSNKTLEIVSRIENSVVQAITSLNQSNQDEKINNLQHELQITKSNSKAIEGVEKKLEDLTQVMHESKDLISTRCTSEEVTKISEQIKKDKVTVINHLKPLQEKISSLENTIQAPVFEILATKLENMSTELESINKNLEQTYKSIEKSVTANFNITKNINQISSQLQKSNTEESLQLANQQSQHFELETSNRFTQLSDDKNSDTDAVTERDTSSRKALLIGNSHVKRIRTGNFIQNCLVHKYIEHSCEGMMDKIEELDTDYECILLHVFTNNIRDDTVEECVQKTEELIDALRRHCQFAKIIISLPFLTIQDKALNNKIEECNILLQYKFLKHVYVTISNNSRLSSGNVPIKKFYGVDGLHLSNQGVSVFVAGIKFHMKNILQVTETLKMRQQASKPERGPKQNRHERSFSNQTHSSSQKANDQSPMSPFFMYPWGPGYNYNQMMYPPQMNDFHRKW